MSFEWCAVVARLSTAFSCRSRMKCFLDKACIICIMWGERITRRIWFQGACCRHWTTFGCLLCSYGPLPVALESSLDVTQLAVPQVRQTARVSPAGLGQMLGHDTSALLPVLKTGVLSLAPLDRLLVGGEDDADLEPAGEAGGVLPPSSSYPSKLAELRVVVPVVCAFPTETFFSTNA